MSEFENGAQQDESGELSLDELFHEEVKSDEVKKAQAEMLAPVGTYTTIPPFTMTKLGKDKNGRPFARFFGDAQFGDHKHKFGLGLSWVRKNARVKDEATGELVESDKPDRSFKNYVMATNAYKAAYGEDPGSVGDVLKYLQDYPIRLRIIQTSDGENMVVAVSAVRG